MTNGVLERVAHGVYRVVAGGEPDHLTLRAAWLQLDPGKEAWARLADDEVALVSHASAASLYGTGDLRADVHEFTLPYRRQTSRPDVRLHRGRVPGEFRVILHGLPATRAEWMIRDLLADHVDPSQVARVTAEVVARNLEYPAVIADVVAPFAARFGLPDRDGTALVTHLLARAGFRHSIETAAIGGSA